jgi:hypothetical protein
MDVAYTTVTLTAAKKWVLQRLVGIPTDLALNFLILVSYTTLDLDLFLLCIIFAFFDLTASLLFYRRIII